METKKQLADTLSKKPKKIAWEGVITNIQANILESLARYKYLTLSQMLALDLGTTQYQYLWKQASSLRDRRRPLVACNSFATPQPRMGKVESMYYLTPAGRQALILELRYPEDQVKYQVGKSIAFRDYPHRKKQIDFQIQLDKWAEQNELDIPFFHCYFDTTGNARTTKNLKSKNRIALSKSKYFIPDGAFLIENMHRQNRFYLFEMCNGKDSKRVVKQLHHHAQAFAFRLVQEHYNYDESKPYYIALLFTYRSIMEAVQKRIQADPQFVHLDKYFICKAYDDLEQEDFFDTWQTLKGEEVVFYG